MGAVWLARDEVLGRQVALKRIGLLPGADSTDLARAEREARLSAQLNHPHVVAVFDVVVDPETDHRWLVMEYVDGITLGQLVREQGRLSPDEAAPLLLQVADALVAAHAAGIAHRDVKPSNILIDRLGRVKLTDFGIARITSDPSLTQTGMVTGSPSYLAPEIATGRGGDEAADVWSLGATLFHLLAGRPPYDMTDNVLAGLYRMVNEEPPRLAEAGWLAPLLEATMVRDPAQRWSMTQVRDFLADPSRRDAPTLVQRAPEPVPPPAEETTRIPLLTGPGSAFATAPAEPASRPATPPSQGRRRPVLLLLLGLVLLVALALGAYAVLSNRDPGTGSTASGSKEPTPSPSATPSKSTTAAPKPTEAGMKSFIRDYVTKVGDDPSQSWQMLTPKFQTESGGFTKYLSFWDAATNGRVLSIDANPDDLTVSYQVRFDNFDNGPGPTVLDLKFDNGKYLIDGESSEGFVPAG
jgi:serine/threonine protein kinase